MSQGAEINDIMTKPLWQLTCKEFCELLRYATTDNAEIKNHQSSTSCKSAFGVHDLALQIGCSDSTIYLLKKNKVLDDAIVSRIGRKIVFDVDKVRMLAEKYQKDLKVAREQDE